jgi:mannose/cellobiose epimerase-like protein (N-acyl-D-glucosamine 2-epimerase family)
MRVTHLARHLTKIRTRLQYEIRRISRLPRTIAVRTGQPKTIQSKATLARILTENIVPFWHPQVIDPTNGGYRFDFDQNGKWKSKSNKFIANQSRTLWFYFHLSGSSFGKSEHLNAARYGYEFLRNSLWDSCYGGFYWEVDSAGKTVTKPDKHLYGQAFGLYALSEYAIASGDESARTLACELFYLLENRAHDSQYGGYREFFRRDWDTPRGIVKDYRNNIPSKCWISVFQFPMISKFSVSSERSRGKYESSSRKNRLHAFL